jgi:hypothetical protein
MEDKERSGNTSYDHRNEEPDQKSALENETYRVPTRLGQSALAYMEFASGWTSERYESRRSWYSYGHTEEQFRGD